MKTIQLYTSLRIRCDVNPFAGDTSLSYVHPAFAPWTPRRTGPWTFVSICMEANDTLSPTYPNQGRMRVGIPADTSMNGPRYGAYSILSPRKLAPVVPAPPWCNAASICGNSQLRRQCGKHADALTLSSKQSNVLMGYFVQL